jgi:hypothetical protein
MPSRPFCIHHCTSLPYRFFGRHAELGVLRQALHDQDLTLVALVGQGGQGKTAIVQHWLEELATTPAAVEGVFLWSFYRGRSADLCLRELYAYAAGLQQPGELSASYCVDRLLPILRRERWAIILDGAEIVQHHSGPWLGRFVHPELGRLLEEIASRPMPGIVVLTTRFPVPELEQRRGTRLIALGGLDEVSARELLTSLGVRGSRAEQDEAAAFCAYHAKAVELLATYLVRFADATAARWRELPAAPASPDASEEEQKVARVLAAYQAALAVAAQDILALATAFREPPSEARLLDYLASKPVKVLLRDTWKRVYQPFDERPRHWLAGQVQELIDLRLLERVRGGARQDRVVIDAHPLVRRAFGLVLGPAGQKQSALARAGFLRGRPERARPDTLEQAQEEIELFHAYCDAGLWNEADTTYVALENPKHRFLAPALERDLLLRFFPGQDWQRAPLWPGFGRYRSLAICFEMLGQYDEALTTYRESDAPMRGDALLALGRLRPLLDERVATHPWNSLWQAYRCHALCLAGCLDEATALARALVPLDVYEWIHVFECLLRAGQLPVIDLRSLLYEPPYAAEHRWSALARERMRLDYLRVQNPREGTLPAAYAVLLESYDRSGLPYERVLCRLSYARWLMSRDERGRLHSVLTLALDLTERHQMQMLAADVLETQADAALAEGDRPAADICLARMVRIRQQTGYFGPSRP